MELIGQYSYEQVLVFLDQYRYQILKAESHQLSPAAVLVNPVQLKESLLLEFL